MKKYFLHNWSEPNGPFSISDLKSKRITSNTEVWCEGFTNWTNAEQIDELKSLFSKTVPPPLVQPKSTAKGSLRRKSKLGRNLRVLGLVLLLGFVGILATSYLVNKNVNHVSYFQ